MATPARCAPRPPPRLSLLLDQSDRGVLMEEIQVCAQPSLAERRGRRGARRATWSPDDDPCQQILRHAADASRAIQFAARACAED